MKLCVTGHDADGKSVFTYAGPPPQPAPGSHELWSTKGPVRVGDGADPRDPEPVAYFPGPGESAFKVFSVRPDQAEHVDVPAELADLFDADDPQMHTTDTIDYVIVLGGQADLELDDGRKERVAAGDCVVQRGTRHAWRIVGDEPFVIAAVLLGAERGPAR
jgi:mannose-6-phosphate isomerase-like protein (cupin superfamily)